MVVISRAPALSGSNLQVYHTTDPSLSNSPILVVYGPCATSTSVASSLSRIQSHVFTPAGFQSYPKLSISPATPLYAAVECLPREEQGDEVLRALAFSIFKYFGELPEVAKETWISQSLRDFKSEPLKLFGASHAASLASRMMPVDDARKALQALETAFESQVVSNLDIDVVLPPGGIHGVDCANDNDGDVDSKYGRNAPLIQMFGEPIFLPTSKMQRAPSRPMAINRTMAFGKKQKENIRRELNELVDTEESYIEKLKELILDVAEEFRGKAKSRPPNSSSPDEKTLQGLFPPCLNSILEVNAGFFDAIRKIADETEDSAIDDIDSTADSSTASVVSTNGSDPTGTVTLADVLLEWFPKFSDCYGQYIQAQPNFAPLIKEFSKDAASTITRRTQETGEQRLTSLLIEPVQRLPRYSLYIDSISKQLPIRHPALKLLLKAKDIISAICDQGNSGTGASRLTRIRSIIPTWSTRFKPQGRFVTAVDALETISRSAHERTVTTRHELLLLLFAGHLVFVRKHGEAALSAGSFVSEVQKTGTPYLHSQMGDSGLSYLGYKTLSDYTFIHSEDSSSFKMIPAAPPALKALVSPDDERIMHFRLTGVNEGRAGRWIADVLKARLEARFPEAERETDTWEVRSLDSSKFELGLLAAVFTEGEGEQKIDRGLPAPTRIVFDATKGAKKMSPGQLGVETVISVSDEGQGFFKFDTEALNERSTRDRVTMAEFLPVLIKRLGNILQMRGQIRNPIFTIYLLQHYAAILNSLSPGADRTDQGGSVRPSRSRSPTKLLAGLFGAGSFKDLAGGKESQPSTPFPHHVPRLAPPQRSKSATSHDSPAKENAVPPKVALVAEEKGHLTTDSFESLECTLSCYLLALKARKGNILASVVARRNMADEAAVNLLYNGLLEDTDGGHERAAQASIDLLFAAFERFMHNAWRDRLGPVIPSPMLSVLHSKMGTLNAFDYDDFEEQQLADLAPQNRRALCAIIATLADLLDGTRNDGDRGALTAAIAETVVCDDDPHHFIPLFDRFVNNQDTLSDRPTSSGISSVPGSVSSTWTSTTKTGSFSSKASSLSKRLGFSSGFGSLRRDNSKRLHKALPPDPPLEKPALCRSHSQDLGTQLASLRRPGSRDQSVMAGSPDSRPGTARSDQESGPSSMNTSPIKRSGAKIKKKRRSSLSDLPALETPTTAASPFWTNSASKKVDEMFHGSSNHVTPSRIGQLGTPVKSASVRYPSSSRNENTLPLAQRSNTVKDVSPTRGAEQDVYKLPQLPKLADPFAPFNENENNTHRSPSRLNREPLAERVASGNTPPPHHLSPSKEQRTNFDTTPSPSKKSRPQTTSKLNERVEANQTAVQTASTTLQEELAKIGQELADLTISQNKQASPSKPSSRSTSGTDQTSQITNLSTRLRALETRITHLTTNISNNTTKLGDDIKQSLSAAERKAKDLDKQLHKANAENDVLYSRMNDELMKVFEQVKKGDGVDEMRKQLRKRNEEAEEWKREVMKLRRENAALKGLVG